MSDRKWCPDCGKPILSSATVKFCCWCGKWLDNEIPMYRTWQEREKIIETLKNENNANNSPTQMKLF